MNRALTQEQQSEADCLAGAHYTLHDRVVAPGQATAPVRAPTTGHEAGRSDATVCNSRNIER